MSLDPRFTKGMEMWIKETLIPFIKSQSLNPKIKTGVGFQNEFDFFMGFYIGLFEGQAVQLYKDMNYTDIPDSKRMLLEDVISSHLDEIREAVKKKTSRS